MRIMFALGFLVGVVVGIYLSPVKKGITVTNYNQCENVERENERETSNEHEQD